MKKKPSMPARPVFPPSTVEKWSRHGNDISSAYSRSHASMSSSLVHEKPRRPSRSSSNISPSSTSLLFPSLQRRTRFTFYRRAVLRLRVGNRDTAKNPARYTTVLRASLFRSPLQPHRALKSPGADDHLGADEHLVSARAHPRPTTTARTKKRIPGTDPPAR